MTEATLLLAFEGLTGSRSSTIGCPPFAPMARELKCECGRPDLVGAPTLASSLPSDPERLADALRARAVSRVLSVLEPDSIIRPDDVMAACGLSRATVTRALAGLERSGLVVTLDKGEYALARGASEPRWQLWAFEVKLDNWKRALYQAVQYQAFAHVSVVVTAEEWAHRLERHLDLFETSGVGAVAVDVSAGTARVMSLPRIGSPRSRFQYYYALGNFLSECSPPPRLPDRGTP